MDDDRYELCRKNALEEKVLKNGIRVLLRKWRMSDWAADALGRPRGQIEMAIVSSGFLCNEQSMPSPSYYLSEQQYRRMFESIKNGDDCRQIISIINDVKSEEDAKRLERRMERHPYWFLVPDEGAGGS